MVSRNYILDYVYNKVLINQLIHIKTNKKNISEIKAQVKSDNQTDGLLAVERRTHSMHATESFQSSLIAWVSFNLLTY